MIKDYLAIYGNGMTQETIAAYSLEEAKEKAERQAASLAGGRYQKITLARLTDNGNKTGAVWEKPAGTLNEWRKAKR